MVSKDCFNVEVSLCRLCEYIIFGMNASHVFFRVEIIPLIVGVIGVVVTRLCTGKCGESSA